MTLILIVDALLQDGLNLVARDLLARRCLHTLREERLKQYNLENLQQILDKVEVDITLSTFRNGEDEQSSASSSFASSMMGFVLGFVLYFFLVIYGSIVMQSIIEEKNSRILEVLVSTVRPFDMMMGKILGVAAVAATQIVVWGVLIIAMSAFLIPAVLPDDIMSSVEAMHASYMSIHGPASRLLNENRDAVDRINRRLGYRFLLREATWPDVVQAGKDARPFAVKWKWSNAGVAPCYADAFPCLTVKDAKGRITVSYTHLTLPTILLV